MEKSKRDKMKKFTIVFISLLFAGSVQAQSVENDLVGLGMQPVLAEYIAGILPAGSVLGNNTFLKGRNAANSADISILKVDGSDETVLNADTGDSIVFAVATTPVAVLGATGFSTLPIAGDAVFTAGKTSQLAVNAAVTPGALTGGAFATPAGGRLVAGVNVLPAAMATAANFVALPDAATHIGKEVYLAVPGALSANVAAGVSTNTLNAVNALTPVACASGICSFKAYSATGWVGK
jgi:hypothetical protein